MSKLPKNKPSWELNNWRMRHGSVGKTREGRALAVSNITFRNRISWEINKCEGEEAHASDREKKEQAFLQWKE